MLHSQLCTCPHDDFKCCVQVLAPRLRPETAQAAPEPPAVAAEPSVPPAAPSVPPAVPSVPDTAAEAPTEGPSKAQPAADGGKQAWTAEANEKLLQGAKLHHNNWRVRIRVLGAVQSVHACLYHGPVTSSQQQCSSSQQAGLDCTSHEELLQGAKLHHNNWRVRGTRRSLCSNALCRCKSIAWHCALGGEQLAWNMLSLEI